MQQHTADQIARIACKTNHGENDRILHLSMSLSYIALKTVQCFGVCKLMNQFLKPLVPLLIDVYLKQHATTTRLCFDAVLLLV